MAERGPLTLMHAFALVGQLGFVIAGGVAAGAAAGWALDRWAGTEPMLAVVGVFVGLAGGGVAAYRLLVGFARDGAKSVDRDDAKPHDAKP
jgi:F0F1-type ATP synthase assembly protein I